MGARDLFPMALLPTLVGCCTLVPYTGDGSLGYVVQGPHSYELKLGEVRLSERQRYSYTLKGLPNDEFVLGLQLDPLEPNNSESPTPQPLHASVRLRVLNERDELVIAEEGELSKWQGYGGRMLFQSGRTVEVPIGNDGSVSIKHVDKRADEGWGTYFIPRCTGTYRVELVVVNSDPSASRYRVTLVGHGGPRLSL